MSEQKKLEIGRAIQIIKSRTRVPKPGKYALVAVNVNDVSAKDIMRGDAKITHIANFKGATPYHAEQAKDLLREGKTNEAANQQLSFGILDGGYVPQAGEICHCQVGEVELKNGEKGLFITSITPQPMEDSSAKIDLGEEFDAMLEEQGEEEAGDEA